MLEDDGLDGGVTLAHDIFVEEFLLDVVDALHVGVDDVDQFGAVAVGQSLTPLETLELQEEVQDVEVVDEVDEGEPHTALGLQVHGQVEVVVGAFEVLVYQLQHVVLKDFDGNVLDHESGQSLHFFIIVLLSSQDAIEVHGVVLGTNQHLLLGLLALGGLQN